MGSEQGTFSESLDKPVSIEENKPTNPFKIGDTVKIIVSQRDHFGNPSDYVYKAGTESTIESVGEKNVMVRSNSGELLSIWDLTHLMRT